MEMLLQNKLINYKKIKKYKDFRRIHNNIGAEKMLQYLVDNKIGENELWDENQTMQKIKEIRRKYLFKS